MPATNTLASHPDCDLCPLHEEARCVGMATHHLPTSLPPLAHQHDTVYFLGQNPGSVEDRQGQPFMGPSGQLLRTVYIAGINLEARATIYLANGVRCHTTANATPKPANYRACMPYTLADLCTLSPLSFSLVPKRVIVCLGAPATAAFFKELLRETKKVSLREGFNRAASTYTIFTEEGARVPWTFFCTYHPAAVLRDHNLINAVSNHMGLLSDYLEGTIATPSTPTIVKPRSPRP